MIDARRMETSHPTLDPDLTPFLSGSLLENVELAWLPGERIPAPQRDLLVHDRDMTTSLGDFYGDTIADPDEEGDLIPEGLLGDDGYCFDLVEADETLTAYVRNRIQEAYTSME